MTANLGDRYEILEQIGQGGFATVYKARDTELDRLVALKELKPVLLQDTNWVRRFRREARAIAKLDHPRIVPVFDVSQAEERLFIVMRLVDGPSLEERLARQGRLAWPKAVDIVAAIAEGLDYAHAQGITHRDLKPANILLDPERGPLLSDFGLAKLAGESSMSLTAQGSVLGTPHYLAPEIWEGQAATPQADIYALGCILYEMLTGEKIFKGETPPAVMMAHFKPLSLASDWPAGVPKGITQVIKKALAVKPTDRYATAGELAAALIDLTAAPSAKPVPQKITTPETPPPAEKERPVFAAAESKVETYLDYDFERGSSGAESRSLSSSGKWRGFLAHLGPYVMVIGALAVINFLTDPGGEPWFIWPAMGWGVGLAFHLHGLILSEMKHVSEKWRGFFGHFGSYAIIMGLLVGIYLMSGGGEPWFLWPAGIWGAAVGMHLWSALLGGGDEQAKERTSRRAERRAERLRRKADRIAPEPKRAAPEVANPTIQIHLTKARAYRQQIEALVRATKDNNAHTRLQDLADQVDEWIVAIEALARRVDSFQRNSLIQQDLETVPRSIDKLKARLAGESDETTRSELERTLANRQNQLAALQRLQNTMKRAELKIESTLSSLGTIYPQILTSQSTNQVADYSRLTEEVDEEVRTLQDHLEALEEVKLGNL
ncbi:MAG: protein kinase [Chloroflexota bacterium]